MASTNTTASAAGAAVVALGMPPLPVVQDAGAIMEFLMEYLDDAAEDMLKVTPAMTAFSPLSTVPIHLLRVMLNRNE